jgi:hypothetical protein
MLGSSTRAAMADPAGEAGSPCLPFSGARVRAPLKRPTGGKFHEAN